MEKQIKRIAVDNFKRRAELKVQYLFDDGHCYFHRSAAKAYAKESGLEYHTIERGDKCLEANADDQEKAQKLEALEDEYQTKMAEVLNETDQEKKLGLEIELEELEKQIEELKG